MSETTQPRCARCGCTPREHHKLHCEGRDGNCVCHGGWLDPGSPLTALDEDGRQQNAEYDATVAAATGLTVFLDWLNQDRDNLYLFEHDHPHLARRLRRALGGVHNHASGVTGSVLQAGNIKGSVTFR